MTDQTQPTDQPTNHPIPRVVCAILEIAELLNVENIKERKGAWIKSIENGWVFAVNGHETPLKVRPRGCMQADIPGCHFGVWYNGWLVGLFNACDGVFANGQANEDAFLYAAALFLDTHRRRKRQAQLDLLHGKSQK